MSSSLTRPGPHVKMALGNSAWIIVERGTTLFLHFVVGILIARYLGPEAFGSLSYAVAFIALLATIPYLGLAGVVVQQLVQDREGEGEIIGTVLGAKLAAAAFAVILANVIAATVEESDVRLLILLISISMLFDVGAATRLMFEARSELRGPALVGLSAAFITTAFRAVAVFAGAPLWVFAALVTAQSAIVALGYVWIAKRIRRAGSRFCFSVGRAKGLFRQSWPLIIASATAILYLKIDQIMLGQLIGMESVGTYAVAARLSEVWYFLPTAIATAILPRLVELKAADPAKYERRIKEVLRYLFWLSLGVAIPVSLAAPLLITLLFGEAFREAGSILAIHIWACPAVFMGAIIEKWFLTEDLLKYLVVRQVLAALLNVALNLLLIPAYGGVGAAIATVIAYTFAYYFSCFTSRRTAVAGRWMTEAIFRPFAGSPGSAAPASMRE